MTDIATFRTLYTILNDGGCLGRSEQDLWTRHDQWGLTTGEDSDIRDLAFVP
jgi:hypothetical protein